VAFFFLCIASLCRLQPSGAKVRQLRASRCSPPGKANFEQPDRRWAFAAAPVGWRSPGLLDRTRSAHRAQGEVGRGDPPGDNAVAGGAADRASKVVINSPSSACGGVDRFVGGGDQPLGAAGRASSPPCVSLPELSGPQHGSDPGRDSARDLLVGSKLGRVGFPAGVNPAPSGSGENAAPWRAITQPAILGESGIGFLRSCHDPFRRPATLWRERFFSSSHWQRWVRCSRCTQQALCSWQVSRGMQLTPRGAETNDKFMQTFAATGGQRTASSRKRAQCSQPSFACGLS